MVLHSRKLLYDVSLPPLLSIHPPPSSLIYIEPKQSHDLSPFLIPLFVALGVGFLIVAYFTIAKKYYLSSNNRTPQNQDDHEDGFVDENHDQAVFHPIWLINTIGLEQQVIDSISVFKYKKNEGLVEGAVCSICLSDFEEDETLRLLPKCNHAFHVPCIDMWLSSHTNCPTCRAPIVNESFMNTQTNESGSNSTNLSPIEETFDETLGDHQMGSEIGTRSEELIQLPKSQCLATKGCDLRVFSDLGEVREKVEAESEPVRRSISMDPSFASRIYRAMTNIHEMEHEGSSSTQVVQEKDLKSDKGDKGVNANSTKMKSSSFRFSFRKGPISIKSSSSSN